LFFNEYLFDPRAGFWVVPGTLFLVPSLNQYPVEARGISFSQE